MCLTTVAKIYDPPLVTERVGWKVFRVKEDKLLPELRGKKFFLYKIGMWINEKEVRLKKAPKNLVSSGTDEKYPCGFHYFKKKKDALDWRDPGQVVRKVRVRQIVATGHCNILLFDEDDYPSVGVAKEMMILP